MRTSWDLLPYLFSFKVHIYLPPLSINFKGKHLFKISKTNPRSGITEIFYHKELTLFPIERFQISENDRVTIVEVQQYLL